MWRQQKGTGSTKKAKLREANSYPSPSYPCRHVGQRLDWDCKDWQWKNHCIFVAYVPAHSRPATT